MPYPGQGEAGRFPCRAPEMATDVTPGGAGLPHHGGR